MKIGIVGRSKDTLSYEKYLHTLKIPYITSLSMGELGSCDALIFPGGGDITPQLFHQSNQGSQNIDTELDLFQLRAFDLAYRSSLPILGICKGMQLINVGLGGTLTQHLSTANLHTSPTEDLYHATYVAEGSFLEQLYSSEFAVNSRHHQAVNRLGEELIPIQWCPEDFCIEALTHRFLPIIGVQWHPERLQASSATISGIPLFQHFLSFV
jgi:putative glutamine amidotransferase